MAKVGTKSLTLPEDVYWTLQVLKARAKKETWAEFFEYVAELVERDLSSAKEVVEKDPSD
ncbi:hypothetical protein [Geoglobus sp.]